MEGNGEERRWSLIAEMEMEEEGREGEERGGEGELGVEVEVEECW
jgi:hypothetical protein